MDYIKSAAGSETSDRSFSVRATTSKINWALSPLPLRQVRPDYTSPASSGVRTLASCCLSAISEQFDQFPLSSFSTLPPHLIRRILQRARADRNYDDDTSEQINTHPDETTIWAIQAMYLPAQTNDHTLGLPSAHLLRHMYEHPLTVLPTLPGHSSQYRFLTTLRLDVSDGMIDDSNIVNLKWCTHLTALWTTSCSITDYGIALLASALELPGRKGMCRLRAWSLARCRGITDKSMRSLARFPGLVMLDLRETSCTSVAIGIFNRHSVANFGHPGFQPCTEGLMDLFAIYKPPSEILSYLCSTLLHTPDFAALHIVPTTRQISPHHTPFPVPETSDQRIRSTYSSTQAYCADGVGTIYGQGVRNVADSAKDLRRAVNNLPLVWQKESDRANGIERRRVSSDWDNEGNIRRVRQSWQWEDENKPKPKYFKMEQRRKKKEPEIKGDPKLMLVRMLDDGWENLTWRTASTASSTKQPHSGPSTVKVRAPVSRGFVDDFATMPSSAKEISGPFRPTRSSPPLCSSPPEDSKATFNRPSLNPFRTPSSSPSTGIRPLKVSMGQSEHSSPQECGFVGGVQKKRRFGGAETAGRTRAGMRMFTVKR